jgi:mono/diheme cytochrome c family protein
VSALARCVTFAVRAHARATVHEVAPEAIIAPAGDEHAVERLAHRVPSLSRRDGAAAPSSIAVRRPSRAILGGTFDAPRARLEEWRSSLHSLNHAPSLAGLAGHLRRDWIREFLLRPHDVRPGLEATMPRLPISEEQAADLARALTDGAPDDAPRGSGAMPADRVASATALLRSKGCLACHGFSGVAEDRAPGAIDQASELAPDLRFTRERMDRDALLAWLRDPGAVRPGTSMPAPPLTARELEALAELIMTAPLAPISAPRVPD